ncbi:MAG: hypothetical protein J7L64_00995 [Acidobacteria bacterium]|nr:hypothetical protein [Acidobacteriota bacterium]
MECYYHKDREAVKSCYICGKPLCEECAKGINGRYYCVSCIEKGTKREENNKGKKTPAVAAFLSLIPGLGQIYNNEYLKAIALMLLFGLFVGFIIDLSMIGSYQFLPFAGIVVALVYFGGIVDAYFSAKRINEEKEILDKGSVIIGIVLVIIGLLFLFENLGYDLSWLLHYWPLLLIILGVYQIIRYLRKR